jgi:hypothetical protein
MNEQSILLVKTADTFIKIFHSMAIALNTAGFA